MNPNRRILETAVTQLGPLADEMVFLGGCATALLITDPAAAPVRVTYDVDVITETASYLDYARLSEKLRERGFTEDKGENAVICRWQLSGLVLDVMPTDPATLGFGNRWYAPALKAANRFILTEQRSIWLINSPYFLATKLEAFDGRGKGDFLSSHDIEDIVTVVDGRAELISDIRDADDNLQIYLAERFARLLDDRRFVEALGGHLQPDSVSQDRLSLILERLRLIADGTR